MPGAINLTQLQKEVLEALAEAEATHGPVYDNMIADQGLMKYGWSWSPSMLLDNRSFLVLNKTLGTLRGHGLIERFDDTNKGATARTPGLWSLSDHGRDLLGVAPV